MDLHRPSRRGWCGGRREWKTSHEYKLHTVMQKKTHPNSCNMFRRRFVSQFVFFLTLVSRPMVSTVAYRCRLVPHFSLRHCAALFPKLLFPKTLVLQDLFAPKTLVSQTLVSHGDLPLGVRFFFSVAAVVPSCPQYFPWVIWRSCSIQVHFRK